MSHDIDRLVLFRLSGACLAIDLASVTEVTELPETWHIPLAPVFFKGVMNSHGSLIPVLDLASWMRSGIGEPRGKILILDRRLADLALWVDEVERVIPLSDAVLVGEGEGDVAAVLEIEGAEVHLLSAESMVRKLESCLQGKAPGMVAGAQGNA